MNNPVIFSITAVKSESTLVIQTATLYGAQVVVGFFLPALTAFVFSELLPAKRDKSKMDMTKAKLDFYAFPIGPMCRCVTMTLDVLKVDHNLHITDIFSDKHPTFEFHAMNPQDTVPFMKDGSTSLTQAGAIMIYLADKYGGDKSVYPEDMWIRAKINERLFFALSDMYETFRHTHAHYTFAKTDPAPNKINALRKQLKLIGEFAAKTGFVAETKSVSIADLAVYAIYSSYTFTQKKLVNLDDFPEAKAWAQRVVASLNDAEKSSEQYVKQMEQFSREKSGGIFD